MYEVLNVQNMEIGMSSCPVDLEAQQLFHVRFSSTSVGGILLLLLLP